ncbi:MAG: AAA family ATPase [Hydrogenophaga sp.]
MFKKLELGNFKRFQNASIDFAKINIIAGPNNSGKSSIIGAMRLICQTLDSFDDQVTLLLNGPFGDFGTFKDVIYRNHRGRPLEIALELEVSNIDPGKEVQLVRLELVFKYSQDDREIYAQSVRVFLDKSPLIEAKYSREGKRFNIEKIGNTIIPSTLKNAISREFRVRHFFPVPLAARLGLFDRDSKSVYAGFTGQFNQGPDSEVLRKLIRVWTRLSSAISKADYLGPLRIAPSRTYLFTGERSRRIGVSGENLTSILATKDKRRDRTDDRSIQKEVNAWLQKAEMAKEALLVPLSDRHFEIRIQNFFTKEDQNIADVGFGHSQVLPFLTGGFALAQGSTYFVEQPELHLHPKAQAELGDFIKDLYKQSVQTVIETHSEHLILRLQQHVAAGDIDANDIRILYVGNASLDDDGRPLKEVTPIGLDSKGQFTTPWPKGFFPEKLHESKRLAKIRLQKQGVEALEKIQS